MRAYAHILLSGTLLLAALQGCRRQEPPVQTNEYGFGFEFHIVNGIRNDASVIMLPQVAFRITEGDEAADYSLYFTVNGKDGRTLRNIWLGKDQDLSTFFEGCTAYGTYVLKGEVYRTDGLGDVKSFEEAVYMQGEAAEAFSGASFVVGREQRALIGDGPVTFYVSETGYLTASYTPKTAHVTPEVTWEGTECLSFDTVGATASDGTVKVPFRAAGEGNGTLSFKLTSGEASVGFAQEVRCIDDPSRRYGFDVSVSAPSEVTSGGTLKVTTSLTEGNAGSAYDIVYSIDGQQTATDRGKTLSTPVIRNLQAGTVLGDHRLTVRVSRNDGQGTPVEKELSFRVAGIAVSGVSLRLNDGTTVTPDQTLRLTDPSGAAFTVAVSPADATVKSVSVASSDASVLTVSGSGTSWAASAGSAKFGKAKLTVTVKGVRDYSFEFPVEVIHAVTVTVSGGTTTSGAPLVKASCKDAVAMSAGLTISGTWKAWYSGTCTYTTAEGSQFNPSEETHQASFDSSASGSFSWKVSGSGNLFDLSTKKAEVEAMTETSSWWDDDNQLEEWRIKNGEEHYRFVYTGAEVTVTGVTPASSATLLKVKVVSASSDIIVK